VGFEATAGLPPHQNTVGHQWRKACERAQVTDLTLHDLRHFYASGRIAAGCDVVTVQRALGQAKATTTPEHLRAPLAEGRGPHSHGGQRPVRHRHS
jgi:integrase